MAFKITIDAGHYGKYNPSPAVKGYYESDMVWKLHLLLKKYLEQYGFEVTQTRSTQGKDLDLYKRGAASKGSDLVLSLHSNAVANAVNESVDYVAVYHLTDDTTTKVDDVSKEIAEKIAPVIADVMGVKQGYKVLSRKSSSDKNKDGIMNDNYYGVLNGARQVNVPGLILEHSFHTQTRATKWLMDDSNLDKLAQAEAKVIADYYGVTKPTQEAHTVTGDGEQIYRIRTSWANASSQTGAYKSLESAKKACSVGYSVYDKDGKEVYTNKATSYPVDSAKSFSSAKAGTYIVSATSLNLRCGASTSKQIIETMAKGNTFTCYGYYTGDWLFGISKSGKKGFCHKDYLKKK